MSHNASLWKAVAASLLLSATTQAAPTLIDTGGFEAAAGFQSGALSGQEGWVETFLGSTASTADVQDDVALGGNQAVRLDRAPNSDGFWLNFTGAQSGRYVNIDWDMRVDETTPTSLGLGPFFGIQVFDDSQGPVNQLAGFGVDAAAREVLYQAGGTGELVTLTSTALGGWDRYRIELDFLEDEYTVYLGEQRLITTSFVSSGVDRLTDIDIVGIAAGADAASQAKEGTAYFDNLLVRDGLRGDFSNNGVVDAADYSVWRDQNTMVGSGLAADANADGAVDAADYAIWVAEFGLNNALPPAAASVPEPAGGWLLGAGAVVLLRRR